MTKRTKQTADEFWGDRGFDFWDTGGGMQAYGKTLDNGCLILITNAEGDDRPKHVSSRHLVGVMDVEGYDLHHERNETP